MKIKIALIVPLLLSFFVVSFAAATSYCTPTTPFGVDEIYISRVQLGILDNATAGDSVGPDFYILYSGSSYPVPGLSAGRQYTLTVRVGGVRDYGVVAAWIDFNGDGIFQDTDKLGEVMPASLEEDTPITFTVPEDVVGGAVTRLRVREVLDVSGINPCDYLPYEGETEDYNVRFNGLFITNTGGYTSGKEITAELVAPGATLKYAILTGSSCTTGFLFSDYEPLDLKDEAYNGKYVCFYGQDSDGNSYFGSTQITGIDSTPPTFDGEVSPWNTYATTGNVPFLWTLSDALAGVYGVSYTFATDSTFSSVTHSGFTTSSTGTEITELADATTYRYVFTGTDNVGNQSVEKTGFVSIDSLPPAFTSMTPVCGASVMGPTVTFAWTIAETGTLMTPTYYVATNSGFTSTGLLTTGATFSGFTFTFPMSAGTYRWKVVAYDAAGLSGTTNPLSFLLVVGGGKSIVITPDLCPDGDESPTLYDAQCQKNPDDEQEEEAEMLAGSTGDMTTHATGNGVFTSGIVVGRTPFGDVVTGIISLNTGLQEPMVGSPSFESGLCADPDRQNAYEFAHAESILTDANCMQAHMDDMFHRREIAKIMTDMAVNLFHRHPDLTKKCAFTDIAGMSVRAQQYIVAACQLGLMGLKGDGTPASTFTPQAPINKAQFATVIGRLIYGEKVHTTLACRYCMPVTLLYRNDILTLTKDLDTPLSRWQTILMLMRIKDVH